MQYVLFNVPNLGFVEQTMEAMVDGIAESIRRAHEAVQPGTIFIRSYLIAGVDTFKYRFR
jgi:Neutral/alkaline non-lysosomal ceramidase, N-terminal